MIAKIIEVIRRSKIDLSNEKQSQSDIASVFESEGILFEREVRLSESDVIDFMVGDVGIEVKLRGANKKSVFRQLTRYATHEQVKSLILVTNTSMGLPPQIEGKDVFYVSLAEGWM